MGPGRRERADRARSGRCPRLSTDIVVEHVSQRFAVPREERELTALQDVSLDVRGSEFVSIVGPSGCGKSTLLGMMAGLVPITEGRIVVGGRVVNDQNRFAHP